MSKAKLNEALEGYLGVKRKIEALEAEMKEHRAVLEAGCEKAPENQILLGVHKVKLYPQTRESVDVKAAREEFGKKLEPFIRVSSFTVLRVN